MIEYPPWTEYSSLSRSFIAPFSPVPPAPVLVFSCCSVLHIAEALDPLIGHRFVERHFRACPKLRKFSLLRIRHGLRRRGASNCRHHKPRLCRRRVRSHHVGFDLAPKFQFGLRVFTAFDLPLQPALILHLLAMDGGGVLTRAQCRHAHATRNRTIRPVALDQLPDRFAVARRIAHFEDVSVREVARIYLEQHPVIALQPGHEQLAAVIDLVSRLAARGPISHDAARFDLLRLSYRTPNSKRDLAVAE